MPDVRGGAPDVSPPCNPYADVIAALTAEWRAGREAGVHSLAWSDWAAWRIAELDAGEHGLSLSNWAAQLLVLDPAEYLGPATPPTPSRVLTRRARVAVLEERYARGEQLWSENDMLPNREQMAVAVVIGHVEGNGEDRDDETLTAARTG